MSCVNLELRDGIGHIQLNRADALNALSRAFCQEIDDALAQCQAAPEVRVVLLSSALKCMNGVRSCIATFWKKQ